MALTTIQLKAIKWFAETNNCRPEMSAYPKYRFTNKDTGEVVVHNISTLVENFKADRERQRREDKIAKKKEAQK